MLGLGDAILTGESLIGNEPFAVVLADDLCDSINKNVTSQLIEVYNKYQCSIVAIQEVSMSETNKYGIIKGNKIDGSNDLFQIEDMVEKPNPKDSPSNLAIIGRYIICLLYTSPSPRDRQKSRMPSSA